MNGRQGDYPIQTVPFAPGDRTLLFTDGLIDMPNLDGDRFGYDRLNACPAKATMTSQQVADLVLNELDLFSTTAAVPDDQTMVVVGRV